MARWIVAGLVVLNLMLGIGICLRLEPKAQAQIGHRTGNYATVAGQANGNAVLYILDIDSGRLAVLKNDVVNGKITPITSSNVAEDIQRHFR